jgi:hypothetical protein
MWSRLELAWSHVEPVGAWQEPYVCRLECARSHMDAGWSLPVAMWSQLELVIDM